MVQNLSINPATTALQSPSLTKMQTPSSTPPPAVAAMSNQMLPPVAVPPLSSNQKMNSNGLMNHQHHHNHHNPAAHRKLFSTIDNNPNSNNHHIHQQQQHHSHQIHPQQQQQQEPDLHPSRIVPPDLTNLVYLKRSDSYFMSDELRNELLRKNLISISMPTQEMAVQLPRQVKDYHNLIPLDDQQINLEHKSRTYGYQTISYKATHIKTGCLYYLKRISGFKYVNQRVFEIIDMWKKIQSANICALRDVFGTKEFNGEHSVVFVYDYYPGLETLQYRLYNNPNINLKGWANPYNLDGTARPFSAGKTQLSRSQGSLGLLSEQIVWDYVIQLASIIRTIHSANLACRIIKPSRILVDHKSRLRLSGCAIFDVLDASDNNNQLLTQYQQEDLTEFGRLVLALACNSLIAIQKEHINTSVDIISRNYSADLRNLILHFMTPSSSSSTNSRTKSIADAMPLIGTRFYTSLDNAYTRGDVIENELSKEIENGRLFRLIAKLNIILERQEFVSLFFLINFLFLSNLTLLF
jgi:PAB-dependent poly(A)-specific ribonuclease subunit 3